MLLRCRFGSFHRVALHPNQCDVVWSLCSDSSTESRAGNGLPDDCINFFFQGCSRFCPQIASWEMKYKHVLATRLSMYGPGDLRWLCSLRLAVRHSVPCVSLSLAQGGVGWLDGSKTIADLAPQSNTTLHPRPTIVLTDFYPAVLDNLHWSNIDANFPFPTTPAARSSSTITLWTGRRFQPRDHT